MAEYMSTCPLCKQDAPAFDWHFAELDVTLHMRTCSNPNCRLAHTTLSYEFDDTEQMPAVNPDELAS